MREFKVAVSSQRRAVTCKTSNKKSAAVKKLQERAKQKADPIKAAKDRKQSNKKINDVWAKINTPIMNPIRS